MDANDAAFIRECIRFTFWACGEGICPVDGEDAIDPAEIFMAYTRETGDEDWETVAERFPKALVKGA